MNAPVSLNKVERIRARDGDDCWACGGTLLFDAPPNSTKAATIEHLQAKANGGSNDLDNLVLTHPGCNRMLGTKPVEQKRAIRAKLIVNRAKVLALHEARKGKPHAPTNPGGAIVSVSKAAPVATPTPPPPRIISAGEDVRFWRRMALIGGGAGVLSVGFVGGLVTGLLLN